MISSPARSCGPCGCPHKPWPLTPGRSRGQLAGRLLGHPDPAVADWATGLTRCGGPGPWLVPLGPALTPTTTALEQVLTGHTGWVAAVAVTADGTRAVSGGGDGTVRVWDLATGQQQAELTGHHGAAMAMAVAVTADGTRAVSGGDDGTVRVWDLATGQQQAELTGHHGPAMAVAVTADGTRAVSGGYDGTVRVWDLATGQQQAELTGHHGPAMAVAVTADGTRAVSGGERRDGAGVGPGHRPQQAELTGHHGPEAVAAVAAVAVTADGTRAVSGGGDGTVRVWDLATGRSRRS